MSINEDEKTTSDALEADLTNTDEVVKKPECALPAEKRTPVEVLP
jgi:hypothetical protein